MMVRGNHFIEKIHPQMIFHHFWSIVFFVLVPVQRPGGFCSGVAGGFHSKACLLAFQPVWLLLVDGSVDFNPPPIVFT